MVLTRRLMDANRENLQRIPLRGIYRALESDISAFLWGELDDRLLEEFLWGLLLIDRDKDWPPISTFASDARPLPRSFCILKLLFLPAPLRLFAGQEPIWIASEPDIIALLRAGRLDGAIAIAVRRLRASGLVSMCRTDEVDIDPGINPARVAAALLFPALNPAAFAETVLRKIDQNREEY
jgi:CRISPR-associated protein Csx17